MPKHIPELNNREQLLALYTGSTTRAVAAGLGCCQAAVVAALKRHQIPANPPRTLPELQDREWLMTQYNLYTTHELAAMLGCHQSTVLDALHALNVPVRGHGRRLRKSKYRMVRDDQGRLRKEHRVVMEQHLGRSLLPHEHVHHRDRNGLNNAPDNLVLLSKSEHHRLHWPEIADKMTKRDYCNFRHQCRQCGQEFLGGNRAMTCPSCRR